MVLKDSDCNCNADMITFKNIITYIVDITSMSVRLTVTAISKLGK
jgi:hypothetical protein